MNIGNTIKQLRLKAGLTQEQLGATLGISAQSISKWETAVTMPDITLLPLLSSALGVTIDELFDLTTEQKLQRIEKRLDVEEDFTAEVFKEYEMFLKNQLEEYEDVFRVYSLLAHLYHHRMMADSVRVKKYAREAINRKPEQKHCQWLLQKAEGATVWDWNVSNHTAIVDFYKNLIKDHPIAATSPIAYYEVMDNLLADHRTEEAKAYLSVYQTLSSHKPFLVPIYQAYIALAEYDAKKADAMIESAIPLYIDNGGFLFETAQYYARRCQYEKAIEYYELSWKADEAHKPRYTDALHGISVIYEILGDYPKAVETYDRFLTCLKEEWEYGDEDAAVVEAEREKSRLQKYLS